jgi:hypothetical protein
MPTFTRDRLYLYYYQHLQCMGKGGIPAHLQKRPAVPLPLPNAALQRDMLIRSIYDFLVHLRENMTKKLFGHKETAKRHTLSHTHQFFCPRQGCVKRFAKQLDAFKHADDPKHRIQKFFLCPLPTCKHAVTGRRLLKTEMARHKKKHIKEGHLNIDTDFTPQQVEELRLNSHCPLFWTVL